MDDIVNLTELLALPLEDGMEAYNQRIKEADTKLKQHLFWIHQEEPTEVATELLDLAHYHHMKHSFWPSQFEHDINWWGIC